MAHEADGSRKAPRTALPPSLTESSRPDPQGLLLSAFYVAANGFGAECGGLLCTCVELGHDEGDESVLRGVMTWERKAAGRGERVRPRLCHAALVGDVTRLQRLVRAGAWLMGTEERGFTALMVAVEKRHVDVVRELLSCEGADAVFVGARIAVGKVNAGHSAFSLACGWALDLERKLTEGERAGHATIAHLLVSSGHVGPGDLGGSNDTALHWACEVDLPDVVTSLLADARCTAAIVAQRSADGHTAFSIACSLARDHERKLTEGERVAYATIARLLVGSGRMGPGDLGGVNATALHWACQSGLPDVVTTLLADTRCTAAIVAQRSASGHSAFSIACYWARDLAHKLTEGKRAAFTTIARLLLAWACETCAPDLVTGMLTNPHCQCTSAIVTSTNAYGESVFSTACALACDTDRSLTDAARAAVRQCAHVLAASPHLSPADTALNGRTALASACSAGLVDIVTSWLTDARCSAEVVQQREDVDRGELKAAGTGATAASLMLKRTACAPRLTSPERGETAACARALAASPHLSAKSAERLTIAAAACALGGAVTSR